MTSGATLVDHTTASADLARELSKICTDAGIDFSMRLFRVGRPGPRMVC